MTTLIFVRHGESVANRKEIFAGHFNADLEEKGMLQAEKTAEYIRDNYSVSKVYASDLIRAYKTGKCIADLLGVDIEKNDGLREISAGKWEGVNFRELMNIYKEDYSVWLYDIGNSRCTDGESVREMADRFMDTIKGIAEENDGKTIVIATHATPLRVLQTLLQHGDLNKMKDVPYVTNASVTAVTYNEGKWSCAKFGEDEHLSDLKSGLPENV